MAVTPDDSKTRRNDLPARAARRIIGILFPDAAPSPLSAAYQQRIEKDLTRAIWEEMIAIEGEINLGLKGIPE